MATDAKETIATGIIGKGFGIGVGSGEYVGSGAADWIGVGDGSGEAGGFHVSGTMVTLFMSKGVVSGYRSVKFSYTG